MNEFSGAIPFSLADRLFLITGTVGGALVALRVLAMFLGWDLETDDLDGSHGFTGLSLHGLSAFSMMFGLVGLALSRQSGAGAGWCMAGALLAGLGALWAMARLFRLAAGLQSSGSLRAQDAAGCLGTVSERIPAGAAGRVNVRIGERLREMDAMDPDGAELPTGTRVRVLRVEQSVAIVQTFTPLEPPCPKP